MLRNYTLFGAPVGFIGAVNESMGEAQAVDLGVFIPILMLLAQARELSTCPN